MKPSTNGGRRKTQFLVPAVQETRVEEEVEVVDKGKETRASKRNMRCLVCSMESSQYMKQWQNQKKCVTDEAELKTMQEKVRKACSGLRRVVS